MDFFRSQSSVKVAEKDPDYWSARGPKMFRPIRWCTQELHYYVPYVRFLHKTKEVGVLAVLCFSILLCECFLNCS